MPARSKVEMLPGEVRTELEHRIVAGAFGGYQDLAAWLDAQGYHIAHDSVQRHGSRLRQKIEAMERLAEQAKAITDAAAQAGGTIVDITIQLIHHRVLSMLLEEPESGDEGDSAATPAGASNSDDAGGALGIRDLARMTRILADLNRVTIARQRQAEAVESRLKLQKRAAGEQPGEAEGGLSEGAYHAIRDTLLGINRFAPHPERPEASGDAGVRAPAREAPGEPYEECQTRLDADKRTSTLKACSNAPRAEATPSGELRCCGFQGAAQEPPLQKLRLSEPLQELAGVSASSSSALRSSRAPP
jgi:uncharacterized protein DUF3486